MVSLPSPTLRLILPTMRTLLFGLATLLALPAASQQVTIDRVDAMPALPDDYLLRDWTRVATAYDSLVFDISSQKTYAPFVQLYDGTVNYDHGAFGIETYVGGGNEVPGEAINVLPALVGATLVGADKRTQFGTDWVLRAEEFFNRQNGLGVYLNTPSTASGQDWWYETMPNVFFLQLRDLYPGFGDSDRQLVSVAETWLEAVEALGGSATPWSIPSFNYRSIDLATMTPQPSGVHEPEAAGAIAWILYSAYRETGDARYRIGAELALEDLERRTQNPSYELQLPYGALTAARMNAELGTHYDVAKFVGWSFEVGGLRNWGTIVDTWNGVSVHGLVGEARNERYAFALNGYQQAAALVPLVRYDARLARAIGRWMVNLASSSRRFYGTELPPENQTDWDWVSANDPDGVVAYEGLRIREGGASPRATGDAKRNDWAPTNLGLYGSSSVGYLAALVDSTDVPGVLRLDLRATDFYRGASYASYLIYNPHDEAKTVEIPLSFGRYDVYDAAASSFVARGVQRVASVEIPPDAARVLVFPTAGGTETREDGRLLVNGILVDTYADPVSDYRPRVRALVASDTTLSAGRAAQLWCTGGDAEGAVSVAWSAPSGTLTPDGAQATWSSEDVGDVPITCTVTDGASQTRSSSLTLRVVANQAPRDVRIEAAPETVDLGGTTQLTCSASDPDEDPLTYAWSTSNGSIEGSGATVTFRAPEAAGRPTVTCTASDPDAATASRELAITVGHLVLDLGLGGDAEDASPFDNDGAVVGPQPAAGVSGQSGGALAFDGVDDRVEVPNSDVLNMTEAVTVSVWAAPAELPERELFLVSHGSWQNRWKISVTPEGRARWTVNTRDKIVDLDAPSALAASRFTHLAATYDGAEMVLYQDGAEVASTPQTGRIRTVDLPLLIGQMLPDQTGFNFPGTIDEVQVYNRALSAAEIGDLFKVGTDDGDRPGPGELAIGAPYPNPAVGRVRATLHVPRSGPVTVDVLDAIGRVVTVVHDGPLAAGAHALTWDADGAPGVYVLRARAGDASSTQRFVLLR